MEEVILKYIEVSWNQEKKGEEFSKTRKVMGMAIKLNVIYQT